MSKPITIWVDLVTNHGQLFRIECPGKFEDELHESINHARLNRDWWSPARFEGCSATYMGMRVDRINMAEIVAAL